RFAELLHRSDGNVHVLLAEVKDHRALWFFGSHARNSSTVVRHGGTDAGNAGSREPGETSAETEAEDSDLAEVGNSLDGGADVEHGVVEIHLLHYAKAAVSCFIGVGVH